MPQGMTQGCDRGACGTPGTRRGSRDQFKIFLEKVTSMDASRCPRRKLPPAAEPRSSVTGRGAVANEDEALQTGTVSWPCRAD